MDSKWVHLFQQCVSLFLFWRKTWRMWQDWLNKRRLWDSYHHKTWDLYKCQTKCCSLLHIWIRTVMVLPICWTQKEHRLCTLRPRSKSATFWFNVEDETAPFLVKCRKTFIGAGLGFCNRRVHLFNLWFNNQRKDFHLSVSVVQGLANWSFQVSC